MTPPPPFAMLPTATIAPHPRNVRRAIGDVTEMAESMRTHGVLEPLIVAPSEQRMADGARLGHCADCELLGLVDDRGVLHEHAQANGLPCPGGGGYATDLWRLIAGHRRLAGAKLAGLPEVPAVIRADLDTEPKQLETMLIENLHRSDLTPVEEAEAYEQLQLLGYKPARIAKATGRSRATIDRRLALLRLPDSARQRLQDQQVTLADAEALAEFASDEEAVARLEKELGTPNFAWAVKREQEQRQRAATERDVRAALAKEGVRIIDGPLSILAAGGAGLAGLVDAATGEPLDVWEHSTCAGRVAWIHEHTGQAVEGCADYETNGHEERHAWRRAHPDTPGPAAEGEDPNVTARREHLLQRDRDLKTAAAVRVEFLAGLLRPGPKPVDQTVWLPRLAAWWALESDVRPGDVAALLGLTLEGHTQAERLEELKALVLAAQPDACNRIVRACALSWLDPGDVASQWAWQPDTTRLFLRALDAMGYQLSDVERQQLDELEQGGGEAATA